MFNELPVICLDCGGPALAVQQDCGLKVPVRAGSEVVEKLAAAIRTYGQNRELIMVHGQNARQSVLKQYNWKNKAGRLNDYYSEALAQHRKD